VARIRTIKPEFWQNEQLAGLHPESRLLAIALLNHSDDFGFFRGSVQLVRAACFPFDEDSSNVRRGLDELSNIGWIELRVASDGKVIGRVTNFTQHQRVDRAQESKLSGIFKDSKPFVEDSSNVRRTFVEGSLLEQGTGNRDQGKEEDQLKGNLSLGACPETESPAASEHADRTSGDEKGKAQVDVAEQKPPAKAKPPAEKPKLPALPPVLVFPCRGTPDSWGLQTAQVVRWCQQYPGIDIAAECRKAQAWVEASPTNRKTASGMNRFLVSWINRAANRPSFAQESRSGLRTAAGTGVESFAAERQRLGRRSRLFLTLKTELMLPEFYARHLSAEFDHLLTEEEGIKASIEALVSRGLATFDGQTVTMLSQQPPESQKPNVSAPPRIGSENHKPKGTERQGLVSLEDLISQTRKDKSA
jgi:hypothetical protein